MTGEMSRDEVTRENYPLYFACVDALGRSDVTVEPFDQYQGPYIRVPGKGRYFLYEERGYYWYNDRDDTQSDFFLCDLYNFEPGDDCDGIDAFLDHVENGGKPVLRDSAGNPLDREEIEAECERYLDVL